MAARPRRRQEFRGARYCHTVGEHSGCAMSLLCFYARDSCEAEGVQFCEYAKEADPRFSVLVGEQIFFSKNERMVLIKPLYV